MNNYEELEKINITLRQREQALKESEERYRSMFDNMSNGVAIYEAVDNGEDFVFKDFNKAGCGIEKTSREDVIGKKVTKVFPGVKDFGLFDVFKRVWQTGIPEHFPIEMYKDQRISGWRDNYVYKLPSGEIVAIYDDVTERKQAEEEKNLRLRRVEKQQAALFSLVNHDAIKPEDLISSLKVVTELIADAQDVERVGIWLLDDNGKTLECADVFEKTSLRHVGREKIPALDFPRYFKALSSGMAIDAADAHTDPRTNEFTETYFIPYGVSSVLDAGIRVRGEVVGIVSHEHVGAPRKWNEDETAFASAVADHVAQLMIDAERARAEQEIIRQNEELNAINQELHANEEELESQFQELESANRKLAEDEQELQKKNEDLEAALAVKNEFLSMVSHELRAPLVPIVGYAELLLNGSLGDMPPKALKAIDAIHNRAQALKRLIEDLLELSQLDRGTLKVKIEPLPVRDHIQEIIRDYDSIEPEKPVEIRWEGQEFVALADHTRLHQVLQNLINNAVKYSRDSVEIIIRTSMDNGRGLISIGDNGIGIPPDHIPHVFERFYQVEQVETRQHGGTGLGLAIVKDLVELMGGTISVSSRYGLGTVFTIALPLAQREDEAEGEVAETTAVPAEIENRQPSLKRILVVDDDVFTVDLIDAMLSGKYEILKAQSGPEALGIIHTVKIDLLLLDWMMPGMDGMSVLKALKADKNTRSLPVVFLTGKAEPESVVEANMAGVSEFIIKPFSQNDLLDVINKIDFSGSSAPAKKFEKP